MKTALYLLSGAAALIFALLAGLVFTVAIDDSDMPTRLYQIFLWTFGETTQLLYRTNAPSGAVLPELFSHTQGQIFTAFFEKFENTTASLLQAMSVFPHLTNAVFAASLAVAILPVLRRKEEMTGWGGAIIAAVLAGVFTTIGTLINLPQDHIPGMPTLSAAMLVLGFSGLFMARTNPWLMSGPWAIFALLTPHAWPLLAAAVWTSACYVHHEKQRAWTSLSFFLAAAALAGMTLTGRTQALALFDPQATSMLHACIFLGGAGVLTLKGFLPKRVTLWRLAPLALIMFIFLTPTEISTYTKGALIGLMITSLFTWGWAQSLSDGRKLRGKDSALLLVGLSALFALLPTQTGDAELGHILGWTILAATAVGTAHIISVFGFEHNSGWSALGTSFTPVLGGVLGLSAFALFFAEPKNNEQSPYIAHQCGSDIFALASEEILKNNMRRIAAEPELSLAILSMEKTSVLTLGPLTPGHTDFGAMMSDTSEDGNVAREIMRSRSLDGVVVCDDYDRDPTTSGNTTFARKLIDGKPEDLDNLDWLTKLAGDTDWAIYLYNR
jgi:hypothetical protein